MKKILKSRVGRYLSYIAMYLILWKLVGFEITIIVIGGTIMGELTYHTNDT